MCPEWVENTGFISRFSMFRCAPKGHTTHAMPVMFESPVVEVLLSLCLASLALIVSGLARVVALGEDDADDWELGPHCCECERIRAFRRRAFQVKEASPPLSDTGANALAGTVADMRKRRTGLQPEPALPTTKPGRRWNKNPEPLSQRKPSQGGTTGAPGADVSGTKRRKSDVKQRPREVESFQSPAPDAPSLPKSPARKTKSGGSARSNLAAPPRWPAMISASKSKIRLSSGTLFYCNVVKQQLKRRAFEEAMEDGIDEADSPAQ